MFGYAGKILHIDLTKEKVWEELLPIDKIKKFLGARGINASLLWELVGPEDDPLGEKNALIFGAGVLSGTFAPASGRTTITCKGPATNLYLKSSTGGHWGPELKFAGYDHLVIYGTAKRPVYLWIKNSDVEVRDASRLWGKDVVTTEKLIREELGDERMEIASIGPGGENRVRFASVMVGHNTAGRGGAGAVMGSKSLKGIALRGSFPIRVADPEGFCKSALYLVKELAEFPTRKGLSLYGTAGLVPIRNEMHLFPTRNYQESHLEGAYKISGQYLREAGYLTNRFGCSACGTSCHRYTEVRKGKYEGTKSGGPEYETVASLGAGCGITETEAVLKANELCNRYGLDTISTGSVIQWAMECFEKEVLTLKDTEGLELTWGNGGALVELVQKIALRVGIGDLLAEGVKRAAEKVGKNSWKWAIQVKGLEQSRAEIRARKGYALALAVNPRGPDHLHSQVYAEDGTTTEGRLLIKRICGSEKYATHRIPDKRGTIVRWHEDCYAASDCLGLCTFVTLSRGYLVDPQKMAQMYTYVTGYEIEEDELLRIGRRIINIEKAFNVREGATRKDDTIPWRFMNEPVRSGPCKGMVTTQEELDQMLNEYYELHGWDRETSRPTREILEELQLEDVADQLEKLGKIPAHKN
jgi:aldehyde:ferredoxin oxidoreductase